MSQEHAVHEVVIQDVEVKDVHNGHNNDAGLSGLRCELQLLSASLSTSPAIVIIKVVLFLTNEHLGTTSHDGSALSKRAAVPDARAALGRAAKAPPSRLGRFSTVKARTSRKGEVCCRIAGADVTIHLPCCFVRSRDTRTSMGGWP